MHFANGRAAQENDPVIARQYGGKVAGGGKFIAGTIFNLRAGSDCNCDLAVLKPGGVDYLTCRNVAEMYHAEDAFNSIASTNP